MGSSWLYSTLIVMDEPSARSSLVMAPTASLALRGTAMLFTSKRSASLTPMAAMVTVKQSALVSWKKTM